MSDEEEREPPDPVRLLAQSTLQRTAAGILLDWGIAAKAAREGMAPEFVDGVPIVHAGPYGQYVSRTEIERGTKRFDITGFALLPLLGAP